MTDAPQLIHPTYRYLDRAVRLAGLTLSQWTQLVGAGIGAWLLARLLPFSSTYDLSVALAIAGMPAAASLAAGPDNVHPLAQARALVAWRHRAAIYLPGGELDLITGYCVTAEAPRVATSAVATIKTVDELWD